MGFYIRMNSAKLVAFIFIFCCGLMCTLPQFCDAHHISVKSALNADAPLIDCAMEEDSLVEKEFHELFFAAPLVTFFFDLSLNSHSHRIVRTAYLLPVQLPHQAVSPAHFHIPPPLA